MTVYYHHWISKDEKPVYNNLRVPILPSIATLRAVNPDIPIVVLEDSTSESKPEDWLHFPKLLNFEVISIPFFLEHQYSKVKGHRFLSRLFDLNRVASSEDVIYCDSDVFWFRNPLPLACNSNAFCFDRYNTGFFYYQQSILMKKFFEIFEAYTIGALNNPEIRSLMKRHVGYDAWQEVWDEMTLTFIANEHPELICKIPLHEHVTVRNMQHVDLNEMKMLHANGLLVGNPVCKRPSEREHCRGLLCLIVRELYELISSVLPEHDINLIYTEQEQKYCKTKISLTDKKVVEQLQLTKTEDGLYHTETLLDNLLKSRLFV